MPKVYVDLSIFTKARAFGMISGHIDVPVIPQVGDLMTFGPRGAASVFAVVEPLRVTNRIINANDVDPVILELGNVLVETDDDARKVMCFLEKGYGLFGDVWEVDDHA